MKIIFYHENKRLKNFFFQFETKFIEFKSKKKFHAEKIIKKIRFSQTDSIHSRKCFSFEAATVYVRLYLREKGK